MLLSVIIPVRFSSHREDILTRLAFCLEDEQIPQGVEFIVVDDATKPGRAEQLQAVCTNLGVRYLATRADSASAFNLARARNHGVRYAKGQIVLFMDVDLKPYTGFYNDILNEAELFDMNKSIDKFLMCPVIYLTQEGARAFDNQKSTIKRQFGINAMLSANEQLVEKYSHGTSVIIINRHYYLAVGGQNEAFEGWGYEDYEFTTRLMMKHPQFPIPENWPSMSGHFMTVRKYKGWKAAYRLHGDWLGNKGIYLFHIEHRLDKAFQSNPNRNERRLKKQLNRGKQAHDPPPLSYPEAGRSLLFRDNPFCYGREIAPFWGAVFFEQETKFTHKSLLLDYLAKHKIDRIVFPNPYANKALTAVYHWCRETGFPSIVAERGALPDAVYHDPGGFLTDSESYCREKWDKPLTASQKKKVREYIRAIRHGSHMLEKQANRQEISTVRRMLGIKKNQKVIFVPFQQPCDTVVQHFAGTIGSFDNFYRLVSTLPAQMGDEWCVVYKKHPAEAHLPVIQNAICADDYNTYDIIEIADAIVVINSGVGLYGAMFGKPVYILGDAWYYHSSINCRISEVEHLSTAIKEGLAVNQETVERFVYYLRYVFYSFGIQQQRRIKTVNDQSITATTSIEYYAINSFIGGKFSHSSRVLSFDSPLFDRFEGGCRQSSKQGQNRNATVRRIKLRKLKKNPIKFFIDAIRNMRH